MLALLAAATLAAAQPAPGADIKVYRGPRAAALAQADMLCRPQGMIHTFADPALLYRNDGKAKVQELAELPKANHEKAVARSVAGCANPLVVQYGAGR
ncbi:hypothetical protein LRS10_08060 [Phenylobacterium sp. J426]|uniref:hypothetical protein n=1 Tax=Phenylobacterium sp. J426 TaxID=2898439 RepID=UPI002150F830|nr:hypothetical protein [Phenylobacterium sp. J426]MCR5874120.1 hypothetical protein [Phenylobacterium sp. J426]